MRVATITISFLAAALLAACASSTPNAQMISSTQGSTVVRGGQVTDVRDVAVEGGRSTGLGALVGSVLGGIAGSTIGGGNGSTVASIGGAAAGGIAGQHVEQAGHSSRATEVTVRFDDGDVRSYKLAPGESFRIGDMVTVSTGHDGTRIVRR